MGTGSEFPRELTMELSHGQQIPLLGADLREMKACPHKNLWTDIENSILCKRQKVETTSMSLH